MENMQLELLFYFMGRLRECLLIESIHTNTHTCLLHVGRKTPVGIDSSPEVHFEIFNAAEFLNNSSSRVNTLWYSHVCIILILIVRNTF